MAVLETNLSWALSAFGFFAGMVLTFLGIFVFRHAPHRTDNAVFSTFALMMAAQQFIESTSLAIVLTGKFIEYIPSLTQFVAWMTLPLPAMFVFLALVFPWRTRGVPRDDKILWVLTGIVSLILILINEAHLINDVLLSQGGASVRTPLGQFGFLYTALAITIGLSVMAYKHHHARTDIERARGLLMISGFAILALVLVPAVLITLRGDLLFAIGVAVVSQLATLSFALVVTYAILRYQAFDAELVLRKGISYTATFIGLALTWVILGEIMESYVSGLLENQLGISLNDSLVSVLSALVVFALISPVEKGASTLIIRAVPKLRSAQGQDELDRRGLEIYRAALEEAWADGDLAGRESQVLATLRRSLGVSDQQHATIEAKVVEQLNVRRATPADPPATW